MSAWQHLEKLKTDPRLLKKLRDSAGRELSPEEKEAQKISFLRGCGPEGFQDMSTEEIHEILARS